MALFFSALLGHTRTVPRTTTQQPKTHVPRRHGLAPGPAVSHTSTRSSTELYQLRTSRDHASLRDLTSWPLDVPTPTCRSGHFWSHRRSFHVHRDAGRAHDGPINFTVCCARDWPLRGIHQNVDGHEEISDSPRAQRHSALLKSFSRCPSLLTLNPLPRLVDVRRAWGFVTFRPGPLASTRAVHAVDLMFVQRLCRRRGRGSQ